jgi:AraC-like DNA-binding protein
MDDRLLALRMAAWMERHLADPGPGRESGTDLAAASGYSENRLRQKFYNVVGDTPSGYLRKRRLTEAARALLAGRPIVDVALSYGYSSQDNFTTAFKSWFGLAPGELRTMDARYRTFLSRMKEPLNAMELSDLKQAPLEATLMGCVKGASDYFDLDWSLPELYGYSTHAFLINIHAELCPSSPYVWKKDLFFIALRNLGIRRAESLCLRKGIAEAEIRKVEAKLRAHLDGGKLVVLDFLEHQLIAGYDAKGFVVMNPWEGCQGDSTLPALSFGSWSEALNREGWVGFTLLEQEEGRADEATLLASALGTALRMRSSPADFEMPGYRVGDAAWEAWIAAVDKGLGASHGGWWSGTVWQECRSMAADFFAEIEGEVGGPKAAGICRSLSGVFRDCAGRLGLAKEKEAPAEAKKEALAEGRELDRRGAELMRELLGAIL